MPKFIHELPEAKALFQKVAAEKSLPDALVEKDYWVMHCLWGLKQQNFEFEMKGGTSLSKGWNCIDRFSEDIDIRFDPPKTLNTESEKAAPIKARFAFYDELAAKINIPGIAAERNPKHDDAKARSGGISLKYDSHFTPMEGLKTEVLLEAGFAQTAPNEPRDFSSWAYDEAIKAGLVITDNRALAIKCFTPDYTFVDKLQTITTRFRQHREGGDELKNRPREFMRHYYDLYRLLDLERVQKFIGTSKYEEYKAEKLRGADKTEFESREAFNLKELKIYELFDKEFESMNSLLLGPGPTFKEVIDRIRLHSAKF